MMRAPLDMALPSSPAARGTAVAVAGVTLLVLLMYLPTIRGMVSIWFQSNTFTHCLFIVPMALFMVYDSRRELTGLPLAPTYFPVAGVAAAGLIWLASRLASIQVTEQLSVVAMLICAVYALLGKPISQRIAYPLAFLFLAVPFGEGLIPHLIEFTGNFAAAAIRWSGIPVFHEGNQIILPTGNWSVVTACSGIRYLLATVTIAAVYGYFSYRSIRRRLAFIALGVLVAIIANGLRAYLIMMIGHLSNMRLAVGVDHILYGWLFFGIVIALLLTVGYFFEEGPAEEPAAAPADAVEAAPPRRLWLVASLVLGAAALWPLAERGIVAGARATVPQLAGLPDVEGWVRTPPAPDAWRPIFKQPGSELAARYASAGATVSVYVAYYPRQLPGSELINQQNRLVEEDGPWRAIGHGRRTVAAAGDTREVRQTEIRSGRLELLVWDWYALGPYATVNPYIGKALQLYRQVFHGRVDGAAVFLATQIEADAAVAEARLAAFLDAAAGPLDAALDPR